MLTADRRLLIAGVLFNLLLFGLWWLPDHLQQTLEFDRTAIAEGQWWRLFTASWVHFTGYHTAMNAIGVGLIAWFLWPDNRFSFWLLALIILPVCVGVGLFFFAKEIAIYRGYSGALYGCLLIGLLLNVRKDPLWFGLATVVLLGKIVYEQLPWFDPDYMQSQIGAAVAAEAHLVGVLSALVLGAAALAYPKRRSEEA